MRFLSIKLFQIAAKDKLVKTKDEAIRQLKRLMNGDEPYEELKSMILSQEENECEIITLRTTIESLDREKKYLEMRLSNPDGEADENVMIKIDFFL